MPHSLHRSMTNYISHKPNKLIFSYHNSQYENSHEQKKKEKNLSTYDLSSFTWCEWSGNVMSPNCTEYQLWSINKKHTASEF